MIKKDMQKLERLKKSKKEKVILDIIKKNVNGIIYRIGLLATVSPQGTLIYETIPVDYYGVIFGKPENVEQGQRYLVDFSINQEFNIDFEN